MLKDHSITTMSNSACADLYTSIIEDVIVESRQDFENAGIDEQTLQDLREIWRQKLVASKVAQFSWAEQDENQNNDKNNDKIENLENGNSNTDIINANNSIGINKETLETDDDIEEQKLKIQLIKKEESDDNQFPDENPNSNNNHNSNNNKNNNNTLNDLVLPGFNQNDGLTIVPNNLMISKNFLNSKTFKNMKKPKNPTTLTFSIRNNQLDGSFDFSFDEDDNNNTGNLNKNKFSNHRNDDDDDDDNDDGVDDDDDDDDDLGSDLGADSDAINSDLDDSDDEDDEDGDGDGEDGDGDGTGNDIEQNIMLCLYDRVQRVRNRWKCSLKDGLMNINGKDYVFQKASGDSEW